MKKLSKRALSLVLSILILASLCTVMITANAAGTTVYYKGGNWSTVYCYMWNGSGETKNAEWPGVQMTQNGEVWEYDANGTYQNVIFNNGSGGTGNQTADLTYPGANNLYNASTGKWEEYFVGPKAPSITASKKDGSSFKSETLDVTITVKDADTASYSVDGGAAKSFTDTVTVTVGAGVAAGSTTTISVTATNTVGTTTSTFTYTKKQAGVVEGDGSTIPALDGYFSTNPNGQVGKQASITIDGSISDWDSSMLIAQGVANDDPRVYRPNSMYEIAMDDYALYAAWDNTNLYLMWEMANVQDAVAPSDTYPISQGNLWINNMPIFLYFSIDPTIEGDGSTTTDATVWNSGITLDANIDTVIACSTNGSNGPFVYKANDDGKIVYNDTRQSSIQMDWGNEVISTELWGIDEGYGEWNNRVPGDVLDETSKWIDFYKDPEHSKGIDMFYEMAIPLDLLGTSAAELTSNGIGLMKVSTFGTSGMNSLPADPSMWDNAHLDYSGQEPNSREKEDADNITVPLARIGKLLEGGNTPVVPPTPTQPTQPTQPTTPDVNPTNKYMCGDASLDNTVAVADATMIQRHTAFLSTLVDVAALAADANQDGEITVIDATLVQRYVAKLNDEEYRIGEYLYY